MMTATKYLDFLSLYELLTETVSPRLLSPGLNRVFSLLSQVKPFFEPRHLELDAVPDSKLATGELAPLTPSNSRLDDLSGIVPDIEEPLAVSDSLIKNVFQRFQIDTAEAETTSTPTVETDKQDYQPGETATITATGFDPGAVVKLQVQHLEAGADGEFGTADDVIVAPSDSGKGHYPWEIKDGSPRDLDGLKNGTIITEWYVNPDDSANETFLLTATDLKTGEAAEPHIFTDSVLDLTGVQSAGFVNGAYIVRSDLALADTGTNDSFLKLKATPEEEGFNTDAAVSQPDVQSARSLQLSELQQVTIAGETFREVRLDLNEKNSASEIVLQELRLFLGNSATLSGYDPTTQTLTGALNSGQAVFDLNSSVLFDAELTPGTSSFDASIYVPESAFAGATGSTYVYLFAKLGSADEINGSDAGFEEFAVADMAGIDPEGTISGRVFEDINADGDDEAGADPNLDNVTVKLFLDDGDGVFEANEGAFDPTKDSLVTTTTSVGGSYSFTDVLAGDYFVRQITPTDLIQTTTDPSLITIGSNTTVTGVDFGNVEEFGSISGQKFEDIDGDGVKDAGEAGLADWTIFVDSDNDGVLDAGETSTTTDVNGDYSFTDLSAGTYTIREVQQTGWLQTTTNPSAINITSGTDTTEVDFGNFQLGTISGQKFEDIDGDGVKDAGEAGLADWTIFIDSDNDGVLDAGETSTTTDVNGDYSFTDLSAGTYTIREVQQTGWVQKTVDPAPINIVESNTDVIDVDFGNREEADLSLTQTVSDTSIVVGDQIDFQVTLTNDGPATATGVNIQDLLPSGFSLISATSSLGTYDSGTGIWDVDSIASGSNATLTLTATVLDAASAADYTNVAEIIAADQFDPDSTVNNGDTTEDDYTSTLAPVVNLDLTKEFTSVTETIDTPGFVKQFIALPGEDVSFTITVANNGVADATDVLIHDDLTAVLPVGLNVQSLDTDGGTNLDVSGAGDNNAQTIEVLFDTIAAGQSKTITVNAKVSDDYVKRVNFSGTLGTSDPTTGDVNTALPEYYQTSFDGTLFFNLNVTKTLNQDIANFGYLNITSDAEVVSVNQNAVIPGSIKATGRLDVSTYDIQGALNNNQDFRMLSVENLTDPSGNPVSFFMNPDPDGGGSTYPYNNHSEFLPPGETGIAEFFGSWGKINDTAYLADLADWTALSADGDLSNTTDEQAVIDALYQFIQDGVYRRDNYNGGSFTFDNGTESQELNFEAGEFSPISDQTVSLVVTDAGVDYFDPNGVLVSSFVDLQTALDSFNFTDPTGVEVTLQDTSGDGLVQTRLQELSGFDFDANWFVQEFKVDANVTGVTFTSLNGPANLNLSFQDFQATGTIPTFTITGNNAIDTITGTNFNDSINGQNGADSLNGYKGNDTILGGNGGDLVNGGLGDDLLSGQEGQDTFVFGASFGNDTITDFESLDKLDFSELDLAVTDLDSNSDMVVDANDTLASLTNGNLMIDLTSLNGGTLELTGVTSVNMANVIL